MVLMLSGDGLFFKLFQRCCRLYVCCTHQVLSAPSGRLPLYNPASTRVAQPPRKSVIPGLFISMLQEKKGKIRELWCSQFGKIVSAPAFVKMVAFLLLGDALFSKLRQHCGVPHIGFSRCQAVGGLFPILFWRGKLQP